METYEKTIGKQNGVSWNGGTLNHLLWIGIFPQPTNQPFGDPHGYENPWTASSGEITGMEE